MGILAETPEEDISAINWVAAISVKAWEHFVAKTPAYKGYSVDVNTDLSGDLSEFGDRLLSAHFPNAGLFDRVATLCVLANCCPFFKLWKDGKPAGINQERRYFFARVSCAFVTAALYLYRSERSLWAFAPKDPQLARFTALLEILDSCTVRKSSPQNKKDHEEEQKTFRALGIGVLAVHAYLECCCKEVPLSGAEPLSLVLSSLPAANPGGTAQ